MTWLFTGFDPRFFTQFTADASSRLTSGPLCTEAFESLLCSPTTNTPQQRSHCIGQLAPDAHRLLCVFHCILCVQDSYLVEKRKGQRAERRVRSNCRPESASIGVAAAVMKPQLTSADKGDCVCVTVCVCSCVEYHWKNSGVSVILTSVTPGMRINSGTWTALFPLTLLQDYDTTVRLMGFNVNHSDEETRRPHAVCVSGVPPR